MKPICDIHRRHCRRGRRGEDTCAQGLSKRSLLRVVMDNKSKNPTKTRRQNHGGENDAKAAPRPLSNTSTNDRGQASTNAAAQRQSRTRDVSALKTLPENSAGLWLLDIRKPQLSRAPETPNERRSRRSGYRGPTRNNNYKGTGGHGGTTSRRPRDDIMAAHRQQQGAVGSSPRVAKHPFRNFILREAVLKRCDWCWIFQGA